MGKIKKIKKKEKQTNKQRIKFVWKSKGNTRTKTILGENRIKLL